MNKMFEVEISRNGTFGTATAVTVALPATWSELHDALDKARITDNRVIYSVEVLNSEPMNLSQLIPQNANLYELNHLAQRLGQLDECQTHAFEGLVTMDVQRTNYAPIPVERLINMTHSLDDCHVVYEAQDDASLGKFYADNDFVPELETLPEKVLPWLDYVKIGKEMREAEGGVFTSAGYVVQGGRMSEEYSFDKLPMPPKPDYVFRLEIARSPRSDAPNDKNLTSLKLPATTDDIIKALEATKSPSLQECVFYGFDSIVPQITGELFSDMDDFQQLNELALEIRAIQSCGELSKYKALLEAAECGDISEAVKLAQDLDSYSFESEIADPSAYAESVLEKLEIPLPQKFFEMSILSAYGEELMEHNNVHGTDYGLIGRKDGEPIMTQEQESGGPVMEM